MAGAKCSVMGVPMRPFEERGMRKSMAATFPWVSALDELKQQGIKHMRQMQRSLLILVLAGGLAACGNTTGDRALSGGGIGAAGGAALGALTGTSVLGGAALGGAAGAATGALTSPGTVNLGRPAWR